MLLTGLLASGLLGGCTKSAHAPATAEPTAVRPGLKLTADEIAKLGVTLAPASPARYLGGIDGFAVVVGRDVIVQAVTDVITARAAAHQSHAALARIERLAGTAGADSAVVGETAERQTVADDAAVQLAEAKASSVLGRQSPWTGPGGAGLVKALKAGRIDVIRVSFPLGGFPIDAPGRLRLNRLDHRSDASSWPASRIWPAPADASMPGRSYFAVIEHADLAEGERLLARATDALSPSARVGVLIPASAVVISADKYWCYTKDVNGTFTRIPVDVDRPQAGGYFVHDGIGPGDLVVTSGAGLLLARDTGPAPDAGSAADADP